MKIGMVCGSFKPCTKGHWALIKRASKENDRVLLRVSLADRKTKGESLTIKGSDMKNIWELFLIPHLPGNVKLEFVPNPIKDVYEILGEASEMGSIDEFSVYSDPDDILERFPIDKQKKYFGDLVRRNQVKFVGVERIGETDVSATQARTLLQHGMKDAFVQLLPEGVDRDGIWNYFMLRALIQED